MTRRKRKHPPISPQHTPSLRPPLIPTATPPSPPRHEHLRSTLHGTRYALTPGDRLSLEALSTRHDYDTVIIEATARNRWPTRLSDLLRLLPPQGQGPYRDGWLSDIDITNLSDLFNTHSPPPGHPGSYLAVDGLFFSRLYDYNGIFTYTGVDTWFRTPSPLQHDVFYVPTNISRQHWTGMIIDTVSHSVLYYDSLGDVNYSKRALYYIRQWMKCELLRLTQTGDISSSRSSSLGDPDLWTYQVNPPPSPSQNNSYDCGIFYLSTILYHIQGRIPNYTQPPYP